MSSADANIVKFTWAERPFDKQDFLDRIEASKRRCFANVGLVADPRNEGDFLREVKAEREGKEPKYVRGVPSLAAVMNVLRDQREFERFAAQKPWGWALPS
jgi:hypothetical protein